MNDVPPNTDGPPSDDGPDELDEQYRRAAQLGRSRPSDAVRRAIIEHATQRAAEHRGARGGPPAAKDPLPLRQKPARLRSRWPLAVFGTLAAAGIAGLLVAPQLPWRLLAPGARVAPPTAATAPTAANAPAAAPQLERLDMRAQRQASSAAQASIRPEAQLQGSARTALPAFRQAPPPIAAPRFVQSAPAANEAAASSSPSAASSSPKAASSSAGAAARAADAAPRALMAPMRPDRLSLREAAETGDVARIQAILDAPVDIDAVDAVGRTALMLATLNAKESAVELLLSHGANPNIADAQGRTPLTVARALRQPEIAAALERAGAN